MRHFSITSLFVLSIAGLQLISCKPKETTDTQATTTETPDTLRATTIVPEGTFTSGVEGPAVDSAGNLYVVNFGKEGTVGVLNIKEIPSLFLTLPEGSVGNGIRFDSHGNMFIADYPKHNILKVDMATRKISVYAYESKMNQPNDVAIDDQDRLYASDPNWKEGTGKLWRIDTNGKVMLLEDSMGTTNGIEVSPDNKRLYVNESVQRTVWVYDLSGDGNLSNKRTLLTFPDFGMDGMRCDKDGNLYIARHGKGTVAVVNPDGKILHEVYLNGKNPSNVTFGGPNNKTVYVTVQDKGNLEKFEADVAGRE
ncbi:MAG: SMP-30/gluconolactonase/LRE family protein [Chryseolinea sp.]